jgi:hypothetical protein
MRLRSLWRNYNLSIVLAMMFAVSFGLQTWMGWREFSADEREHGHVAHWLSDDGYVWSWGHATFQNWQSEFLSQLTLVIFTAYLVHKGSHESKDTDERVDRQLARIEDGLKQLLEERS